jgi:hypothetical protein
VFGPCAICIRVHSQWKTLPKCAEGAAGSNENFEFGKHLKVKTAWEFAGRKTIKNIYSQNK